MAELVIIWSTGEKEIFAYTSMERAEKTGREMQKVFGNQISWWGTREKRQEKLWKTKIIT